MSNPTKAETLCYQALCNIVHLQHQITQVINNEDYENAWPQIENAIDRLNSTTILMEAYEDAKRLNAKDQKRPADSTQWKIRPQTPKP